MRSNLWVGDPFTELLGDILFSPEVLCELVLSRGDSGALKKIGLGSQGTPVLMSHVDVRVFAWHSKSRSLCGKCAIARSWAVGGGS